MARPVVVITKSVHHFRRQNGLRKVRVPEAQDEPNGHRHEKDCCSGRNIGPGLLKGVGEIFRYEPNEVLQDSARRRPIEVGMGGRDKGFEL